MEEDDNDLRQALFDRVKLDDRRGLLKRLESVYIVPKNVVSEEAHRLGDRYRCHQCFRVFLERPDLQEHFWSHARTFRIQAGNSN